MAILDQLATSLGHRDEGPNKRLAERIVKEGDKKSIAILTEHLSSKNKGIRHDCIKVLYEIGARSPGLVKKYLKTFSALLNHTDNRMQWGAMHAIDTIAMEDPAATYIILLQILDAADSGSVITRDHAFSILVKLHSVKKYEKNVFELLLDQLKKCPTNQLPMYAERAMVVVNIKNYPIFNKVLLSRLKEIDKESKQRRIEKVLNNLTKKFF